MEYIPAKTIVTNNQSTGWFGAAYNMNIYRGCCHGCIYCDSRSNCYNNKDFNRVKVKENALELVRNDLRRKVRHGVISTGAMSDPYNPYERELELTRHSLELISAYGFGVAVDTKSPLVTRDIDILKEIASHSPVLVKITVTTADDMVAKVIEPGAAPSSERFQALEELARAGIPAGVLMMPLLPEITDTEKNVEEIIRRSVKCNARFVYPSFGLSMRDGQREYLYRQLDLHYPGLSGIYRKRYGTRRHCASPHARELWNLFRAKCASGGLLYEMPDIVQNYRMGYGSSQLSFFD